MKLTQAFLYLISLFLQSHSSDGLIVSSPISPLFTLKSKLNNPCGRQNNTCLTSSHQILSDETYFLDERKRFFEQAKNRMSLKRYSSRDWLHNMITLPQSSILKEIRNPVVSIIGWSTFLSLLYQCLKLSSVSLANSMCLPSSGPHRLLVGSLGMLLVFRTNSTYQRYTEGLKIWEQIVSTARNIARLVNIYESEIGPKRRRRILQLLVAFPHTLRQHIHNCDENDEPCDIDNHLDFSNHSPNYPLWVCDNMAREMSKIKYSETFTSRERSTFLAQVGKLSDAIGKCERIHETAIPLSHGRHCLRALTIWLATLPFCLLREFGVMTVPLMAVISWIMFGVYQIGYIIEDPFLAGEENSLKLNTYCETIKREVLNTSYFLKREERDESYNNWKEHIGKFKIPQINIPVTNSIEEEVLNKIIFENINKGFDENHSSGGVRDEETTIHSPYE